MALWAYRTTVRTTTQATLYSLVLEGEAILLVEIKLPSLKVAVHEEIITKEKGQPTLGGIENP